MSSRWTLLLLILLIASTCHSFPSLKKSPKQTKEYDYESDSRAVSSNVDLDAVDGAAYERFRHALHSLHARIGAIDDR
ncbi:unnamed protein product [Cylicocyclus nassatus]|uniref:Uncharacterized protein n=1 Tax=Cylicocyclus nassatus TaxID=53992 RepID=A0AA36H9D1_CYLNA|nr:unnamed protein product [Cylicocyclus nassatus]